MGPERSLFLLLEGDGPVRRADVWFLRIEAARRSVVGIAQVRLW
jgi:hypothetical protein